MTERLTQLMTLEAERLDIPPTPTADVLGRGRGLRRRRRAGQAVAGLAVVALIGTGVAVLAGGDDQGKAALDPAGPPVAVAAPDLGAVFSIGPTVYLRGGEVQATVDDVVVKSMYYTSAGLLVRHGENSYSDGGGPQRFSLVTDDGVVHPVSVTTEEVVPGVDIDQPYLAYAEVVDGTVDVVVHDVATDEEVARVSVPDATTWGGWSAPPVSLVGDRIYVGTDDVTRVVDWRTGEVSEDASVEPGYPPSVDAGRTTRVSGNDRQVLDAATGEVLLTVPTKARDYAYVVLSPDGRFLKVVSQGDEEMLPPDQASFDVYDVDTGNAVALSGQAYDWTWTPDGQLFNLDDQGALTTCSAETAECTSEEIPLDVLPNSTKGAEDFSDDLVLGNTVRES
ncbi:hypothetical protein BH11ACT8_BH11ACT8_15100 [soil metagenome]